MLDNSIISLSPKNYCLLAIIAGLFLASSGWVLAVEINTRVEPNPIILNESFKVIFTATQSPDASPNFRVLEQDFKILDQSQNSSISIINGNYSKSIQWIVQLIAKRSGEIIIPAISFGADSSKELKIRSNKNRTTTANNNEDIFIEVEVTPKNPVVQSQIIYTLRIYSQYKIASVNLFAPKPTDVLRKKISEKKQFNAQHNSRTYNVTEHKYAFFPQKSGLLTLNPTVLTAEIIITNQRTFGGFFNQHTTRTKRVVSAPITINVRAIPKNINAQHWLPSEHVELQQKWSGPIDTLQLGEPITRTLILRAKGTTLGQLPQLNNINQTIQSPSGGEIKIYPDQPLRIEIEKSTGMIAVREEKIAIIPTQAGIYQLPAIVIPWWNTHTQQMEFAKIAPTKLTAIGNANALDSVPSQSNKTTPATIPSTLNSKLTIQNNLWIWLAIIFGLGWLITLGLGWWHLQDKKTKTAESAPKKSKHFTINALKQACRKHDSVAVKNLLLLWGQEQWQLSSLGEIACQCTLELQIQILDLNTFLYSKNNIKWRGDQLLQAFINNKPQHSPNKKTKQSPLQSLYKI